MQVANQQTQYPKIYKAGKTIEEIESVCSLSTVNFFDTIFKIEKIKSRKNENGFNSLIGAVLTKASILCGINTEIDSLTKQDLVKMILSSYNELSVEELNKAFELERFGMYDEKTSHFQLFNSDYVSEILKKYKKWKIKEKQKMNYSLPKNEPIIDIEKTRELFLKTVFDSIKETGYYNDAWLLYDDLEQKGKIVISKEVKWELYNKELKKYKQSTLEEISKKSFDIAKKMSKDLDFILKKKEPIAVVSNTCKSILVCDYLKTFISDYGLFKQAIQE